MNKAVYSYLLGTFGRRARYWVALTAVIAQTLLMRVVSVVVIARLASNLAMGHYDAARQNILAYLAVAVCGLGFRLAKELLAVKAENEVYAGLMVAYYRRLVSKDMAFFRDHQTGYLASTFRQHVDSCMELVRLFRGELMQAPISLIVPTAVLFAASWKVGLAALAVVIVQAIYIFWSSSTANHHRARSHEIYRKISGAVSDDVTNIVAYKTSGMNGSATKTMAHLAREETETFWQRRKILALLDTPRELITVTGTAIAFWMVVSNSQTASQSVGLVVLTVTYMFQIFQNVSLLPDLITRHDDLVTKLYPTLEYMSEKYETIRDPDEPLSLSSPKGRIDIENVSFGYGDDPEQISWVFRGLDLHIRPGEQIGVVGLSGAGKSTLASLLMRFDDVLAGSIKMDGEDIRQVRQDDLRQQIAYVPQEPLLFHRSIRDNLLYSRAGVTEEHMIRAAKAAHAHEFIQRLPHGYDTLVGERGVKLSGGQKQRIVIARAILKDAPVMLFDEATSALDSESERIIQTALPEILGRRTAIVIAHRLSTVAGLDRIIVMHHGAIVESGTHKELLELKGRYFSLWQKQTAQGSMVARS